MRNLACATAVGFILSTAALGQELGPSGHSCTAQCPATLFLIDRTTQYDAVDRRTLQDGLYAAVMQPSGAERIVIRTIIDDPFASGRIFDDCRPTCPTGSFWDRLKCSDLTIADEVIAFERSAQTAVKAIPTLPEDHPRSDIFETLTVLASEYRGVPLKRLVIFSDLLQNTRQLPTTFILHARPEAVLARIHTLGLAAKFPGADVVIFGVGRHDDPTRRGLSIPEWQNLQSIWTTWFKEGGARSVAIYQWYPGSS